MIKTREDLKYYLEQDRLADGITKKHPRPIIHVDQNIWRYKIAYRKAEYYYNNKHKSPYHWFMCKVYSVIWRSLGDRYDFYFSLNCIEEGFSILHTGIAGAHKNARIGKNFRIAPGALVAVTSGSEESATIGNNVYLGAGAKILGKVTIADDVCIGANAVVTKDILEPGVTVAGAPARIVSHTSSRVNLNPLLFKNKS